MVKHGVDGIEISLGLIVKLFGLGFELLEATFGINVDRVFGVFAYVELGLELLGRL